MSFKSCVWLNNKFNVIIVEIVLPIFSLPYCVFLISYGVVSIILVNISWAGSILFSDSKVYLVLSYLNLFIIGLVLFTESIYYVWALSMVLFLASWLFFISVSYVWLYVSYEVAVFPILAMLLVDGSQVENVSASLYLVLYTTLCAIPFVISLFYIQEWQVNYVSSDCTWELTFSLTLIFLVKFPVYGLHSWLPNAHVEAPTYASIILAGLLLKLGVVGFIRLLGSFNLLASFGLFWLSMLGATISSIVCGYQSDTNSLVAYSSVVHINYLLLSLLFLSSYTNSSSVLVMFGHGVTASAIFYTVGYMVHIHNTRNVYYLNSLASYSLFICSWYCVVIVTNFAIPLSLSFLSEVISISCVISGISILVVVVGLYVVYTCYYSLYLLLNISIGNQIGFLNLEAICLVVILSLVSFNLLLLGVIL